MGPGHCAAGPDHAQIATSSVEAQAVNGAILNPGSTCSALGGTEMCGNGAGRVSWSPPPVSGAACCRRIPEILVGAVPFRAHVVLNGLGKHCQAKRQGNSWPPEAEPSKTILPGPKKRKALVHSSRSL